VGRVVYTSSVATLLPLDNAVSDETRPPAWPGGAYKRSKVVAESWSRRWWRKQGLPAVIVNPPRPLARAMCAPRRPGAWWWNARNGKMPAYVDTGMNLVHVDDVAQGHLLAERGGSWAAVMCWAVRM
jgi:dihydroflavonol-4-reductase